MRISNHTTTTMHNTRASLHHNNNNSSNNQLNNERSFDIISFLARSSTMAEAARST